MTRRVHSRRDALKVLSALAGAAATSTLTGCDTPDTPPADAEGPAGNPLEAIGTIVVLMMENRTFDHMFGALSLVEGREDVDGLQPGMSNPDADGQPIEVFHLPIPCQEDPPHGWDSSRRQHAGGTNQGFVTAHAGGRGEIAEQAMGYYDRRDLPVYYALADEHAICDRWFCSVMSSTWPNRIFSLCATSGGMKTNDILRAPFDMPSIFDQLDEAGVTWKVYFHEAPFAALLERTGGALGDRIRPIDELFEDLAAERLPQVVFVEPGYTTNDDHPPHPVALGQALVGTVYQALADSAYWDELLMIVDYDEHGGFFDHVPPPRTPDDLADQGFDQLGFRTPGIVIGPYSRRGACSHTQYDHTSVLKTIQERFGLPPLNTRNAAANALWDCLDLDAMARRAPRAPARLPVLEVGPDDFGRECFYSFVTPGQEELDHAIDLGVVDARYDRRHLAQDTLDRMLVRAEKLGVLRFVDGR